MATRNNYCPNPGMKNNVTGWGGGSTPTRSTGLTGLPRTTGAHYSASGFAQLPAVSGITVGPGETWTLSVYFQNNTGSSLGSRAFYFVAQRSIGGDDFSQSVNFVLATGTTRLEITKVTPANTTGLYALVDSFNATVGSGVEITACLYEKVSGPADTYFDGDTASAVWDGVDGNSTSTLTTGGSPVVIGDPTAGGAGSGGQADSLTLGGSSGGGSTGGTTDGRSLADGGAGSGSGGTTDGRVLGDGAAGSGSGGQLDGLALGEASGGTGSGGSPDAAVSSVSVPDPTPGGSGSGGVADGRVLADGSSGSGSGGQADTIAAGPVVIADPVQRGSGSGGQLDTISTGTQVVHDQMVMPLAINARTCLVTEVGKLANPPARVQIRPGASFAAMVDANKDECCDGIAYVRVGQRVPTGGNWPTPLTDVGGPSASRGRASYYAVSLELGVYRCIPTKSDVPDSNDDFPTEAQWLQAAQDQADDGAALLRVVCCLQDIYGTDSVIAGALTPLENQANCSGIIVNVQLRAPACDCVD